MKMKSKEEMPKGFYPIDLNLPSLKAHTGKYYTLDGKEITRSRYLRWVESAADISDIEIYTLIVENNKLRSKLDGISGILHQI